MTHNRKHIPMAEQEHPKLKACPFCGADAISHPNSPPMITCSNTECALQGTYIYSRDWEQRYPISRIAELEKESIDNYRELINAVGFRWMTAEEFGKPFNPDNCINGVVVELTHGKPVDYRPATETEKKLWEYATRSIVWLDSPTHDYYMEIVKGKEKE